MPNYSFEQYSNCPNSSVYSLTLATSWTNPTTNGSPDYFNICSNFTSIPSNIQGYQQPKTGNAYAGLFVWFGTSTASSLEYAQIKLIDSLKQGKKYCVNYFVSRAEKEADYMISTFGAYLSDTQINVTPSFNINVTPQIINPLGQYKASYTKWEEVSGIYIAQGGEQYLVLGNFESRGATDTLYDPNTASNCRSFCRVYYFLDDISIEEVTNAQAGRDTTINCGDVVTLGADSAIGAYYAWIPSAGLSNDSIAFPIASPTVSTTYILKKQQCSVITYDTVKVTLNIACPTPSIDIEPQIAVTPNVFSPNADNLNDVWLFSLGSNVQNVSCAIYNRWGNLIHSVTSRASVTEILWDGRTTSGEACSEGVYFYTLKYTDANGEQQTKNGYVSLFR